MKLLPAQPTREQLDAAHTDLVRDGDIDMMLKAIYDAFYAAAPAAEVPGLDVVVSLNNFDGKETVDLCRHSEAAAAIFTLAYQRDDWIRGYERQHQENERLTAELDASIQDGLKTIERLSFEVAKLTHERDEAIKTADYNFRLYQDLGAEMAKSDAAT